MHIAAYWGNIEVIKILLEWNADKTLTTTRQGALPIGLTPLDVASYRKHKNVVRFFASLEREENNNIMRSINNGRLIDYCAKLKTVFNTVEYLLAINRR